MTSRFPIPANEPVYLEEKSARRKSVASTAGFS
jgi:hypothetical protein